MSATGIQLEQVRALLARSNEWYM